MWAPPTGQATAAFDSGSFGVKVDKDSKPAKLSVIVGGPLCGQKVTAKTARSDMKSCWRPVVWDAKAGKMQFAPLSQIQPGAMTPGAIGRPVRAQPRLTPSNTG